MRTNAEQTRQSTEYGQTLIMFVLFMFMLILFVGLGIDLGFAYITRARLSKAVDAACLMGMRNYKSTNVQGATDLAKSAFLANYGTSGRDAVSPFPPHVTFNTSGPNITLDVSATATINTFFIRVLPQWSMLTIGSAAQATRPNLIMTLVLDKSGSMGQPVSAGGSNGGQFLPGAVTNFINNFDDNLDKVAMVTFSSVQNDVVYTGTPGNHQPTQPFKTAVINGALALEGNWLGATFSQGGLTNALVLENNASITAGEDVVKVVVFFTDGIANTVQQRLPCQSGSTLFNFGGYDPNTPSCPNPCTRVEFMDPISGTGSCTTLAGNPPSCCPGVSTFFSARDNQPETIVHDNVTPDAEYRAVQVADDMRVNKIAVYSIAVGGNLNFSFLAQVANDPQWLAGTTGYKATPYDGIFIVANDASELPEVFQKIADAILLRLSK